MSTRNHHISPADRARWDNALQPSPVGNLVVQTGHSLMFGQPGENTDSMGFTRSNINHLNESIIPPIIDGSPWNPMVSNRSILFMSLGDDSRGHSPFGTPISEYGSWGDRLGDIDPDVNPDQINAMTPNVDCFSIVISNLWSRLGNLEAHRDEACRFETDGWITTRNSSSRVWQDFWTTFLQQGSGHIRFMNGFTLQWGSITIPTAGATIEANFSLTFDRLYQAYAVGTIPNSIANITNVPAGQTVTAFALQGSHAGTYRWFAIGFIPGPV